VKVAICKNNKVVYRDFLAYHYSWWFRIFGPNIWSFIASGHSEEALIEGVKRKFYGKIAFIRIVEI
jgi:hypothetical protein